MAKKKAAPATTETEVTAPAAAPTDQPEKQKKGARPKSTDIQNGIPRPAPNTACGKIWNICDTISTNTGKPAERAAVLEIARKEGLNDATITTQHGRWREYHGLVTKRGPRPEKPASKAAEPTPASVEAAVAPVGIVE